MGLYANTLDASNLPDRLPFTVPQRGIRTALKLKREKNGRHTTGSGARRASSYEHQIDRIDDLVRGAWVQGHVIALETGHGRRRRVHNVEVFDVLGALARSTQGWARVYVRKIGETLDWLRDHHPGRLGWALPQSRARARRDPAATRFLLPRRNWSAFVLWRAVYDLAVGMILTAHRWLHRGAAAPSRQERDTTTGEATARDRAIPLPRAGAPKTKSEEHQHADEGREQPPHEVQGSHDDLRAVIERVGRRFFTT